MIRFSSDESAVCNFEVCAKCFDSSLLFVLIVLRLLFFRVRAAHSQHKARVGGFLDLIEGSLLYLILWHERRNYGARKVLEIG